MMMSGRGSSRYPFTPSQWQELEQQALIYKYMVSGIPIPSDLLLPIRRSFLLDSSPSLALPPHHHHHPPSLGWGCLQMGGYGRKAEDPEPGRCRRTDGKKWRCSKEAYPDSKYCEKHMHRGKNRSRKPVEIISLSSSSTSPATTSASASPTTATTTAPPNPSSSTATSSSSCSSLSHGHGHAHGLLSPYPSSLSISTRPEPYHHHHHLLYPYGTCRHPPGPPQTHAAAAHFHHWDGSPYSAEKDYRYGHGIMRDEYSFISEASSGFGRESSWQFRPLGMSSLGDPKHGSNELLFKETDPNTDPDADADADAEEAKQQQQQHCFVLGADFKLEMPAKATERAERGGGDGDGDGHGEKPLRRFFDEWPPQKRKDSWMDLEAETTRANSAYSKTHLSISIPIPMAHHHDCSIAAAPPTHRNDE